jgi:protein SCO1/2
MKLKIFILVGALILAAAVLFLGQAAFARPYTFNGNLMNPAMPAGEIKLVDQYGNPFDLSNQKGKIVLLFFGYIHCPDICPATMGEFKQVKQNLGGLSKDVDFVFVTVDPERDTPQAIQAFLGNFDSSFIGLTGSQPQLDSVWKTYGVYHQKQANPANPENYQMIHSTYIYLIDKQGQLRLLYSQDVQTNGIIQDIRFLLRE